MPSIQGQGPGPLGDEALHRDLCRLLAPESRVRREAAESIDCTAAPARYALRHMLCFDRDAGLRALAAERLGKAGDLAMAPLLHDAAHDPAPRVRAAALHALARLGDPAIAPRCRVLALSGEETLWWVRRAAALTLAAVAGAAAIPDLRAALNDPFWRVRHAAARALIALATVDPALRAAILAPLPDPPGPGAGRAAAEAALRLIADRLSGPSGDPGPGPSPGPAATPPPGQDPAAPAAPLLGIVDPDPAVTTARLLSLSREERRALPAEVLVSLLADPHEPLRTLAVRTIERRSDPRLLRAALRWLEEPHIPQAAATTARMLDCLGAPARALAEELLRDPAQAGPRALCWACRYVSAIPDEEHLALTVPLRADPRPIVRRAAITALARAGLVFYGQRPEMLAAVIALLDDPDEGVREICALTLCDIAAHARLTPEATPPAPPEATPEGVLAALAALRYEEQPAAVRLGLLDVARQGRDLPRLARAAQDPHPLVRAAALRALRQLEQPVEAASPDEPDPWIREARMSPRTAAYALLHDPEPWVRRAALHRLQDHQRLLAEAAADPDPVIRVRLCRRLAPESDEGLRALLRLSRDPVPMVRTAAADPMHRALRKDPTLARRLQALSSSGGGGSGCAGKAVEGDAAAMWLLLAGDRAGLAALLTEARASTGEPAAADPAPEIRLAPPQRAQGRTQGQERGPNLPHGHAPVPPPRRPLGRTGLLVSPLGLSGVHELQQPAIAHALDAGVNLFFWEPGYTHLGRFLRAGRRERERLVIAAGTFHGDPAGIERDLHAALRSLRTDRIDVFLLFWARSAARLGPEAHACLARLKEAGKVRAIGFSTHHRDLAREALQTGLAWDVIMTRHSAAHPGAEAALFPAAQAAGVGVLTFSALCYGRLLRRPAGGPSEAPEAPPTAADCYRYSLSQPGVSACLCAPRRYRELVHDLGVLSRPTLSAAEQEALRAHGRLVHRDDRHFDLLLRKGEDGKAAARAAMLRLLQEFDPDSPESTGEMEDPPSVIPLQ